ncbi:MAG: UPF0175 family protein [Acidobacteriota bacterium]|nr:UPF0175 family protein [Acidobacteriota bacterium]
MATLTVELTSIPPVLEDQEFARYLIAGSLYSKGLLSGEQARQLTGDARRVFEEKMAQHGFPIMPDDDEEILAELNA